MNKEHNIKQGSIDESEHTEPNTENTPQKPESEKAPSTEDEKIGDLNQAADKKDTRKDSKAPKETVSTQPDTINRTEKRGILSKLAFSIVFMLAAVAVLFVFNSQWKFGLKKEQHQPPVQKKEILQFEPPMKVSKPGQNDPNAGYRAKLNDVTQLRDTLLLKKQEVQELKQYYEEGVEQLENVILHEILSKKIYDYQQALQNKRIDLGLRTIQRRLAYIKKLDVPLQWLEQGSEELLYLKRKATFDLQLIDIAGGIDMQMHMRHINAAIQKYHLTANNLAINLEGAKLKPLETIWKRLHSITRDNPDLQADIDDWYIQQEICSGDLTRIGELSNISIEAAKCLSEMKGSDLFLNGITDLSETVAKYLCQWKGKWICLNGVRTLSPSAAQHLFRWEGEWLSLNGLSELSPELAKQLLRWKGKQLELMGLRHNPNQLEEIALTYLAEWEEAGGKLFVPESIRAMMEKI